jgi:hypothetical protein
MDGRWRKRLSQPMAKKPIKSAGWTGLEPAASGVTGRLWRHASSGGVLINRENTAVFALFGLAIGRRRTPEDALQYTHSIRALGPGSQTPGLISCTRTGRI